MGAVLFLTGLVLPLSPATADTGDSGGAEEVVRDPLKVVIDRVTPSTVPDRGRVTVSGRIRNRSDGTWTELKVYLLTSSTPITTSRELDAAVRTDPRTEISDTGRIIDAGLYGEADDLAPGETTGFRLTLPRDQLGIPDEPGVYWLGVQVLGTKDGVRLDGADGRARTFLPLVPDGVDAVRVSLALQLRNHTVRDQDGRLRQLGRWRHSLRADGRLGRLVRLGGSARHFPLAWVLDPAVVGAARSLSAGNPPITLAPPDQGSGDDASGGASPSGQETADGGTGDGGQTDGQGSTVGGADSAVAQGWLDRFVATAKRRPLLALPYGDADVSALVDMTAAGGQALLDRAYASGDAVLQSQSLTGMAAAVPPDGRLSPQALQALDPGTTVVLSRDAVPSRLQHATTLSLPGGGRVLVAATGDDVRGPGPGATSSALEVRQRLLAEAAVHALSRAHDEPLVWAMPARWDPGPRWRAARFFSGLRVPWTRPVPLRQVLSGPRPPAPVASAAAQPETLNPEDVRYPDEQAAAELGFSLVSRTQHLVDRAGLLGRILADDTTVAEDLVRQALLAPSLWSRPHRGRAARRVQEVTDRVDGWLDAVTVRAPLFVTMSDATGTFQVTLVNGLDVPVEVGLDARVARGALTLHTPGPVRLAAQARGAVRIEAHATDIGIHLVTLQPVSADGVPLGATATLSIRSSRVGFFLWVVMGVSGAVLFVVVVVRIWRRVRQRRATHGPLLKAAERDRALR